ncbi:TPA: hypothetical protein NGR52_004194 [Vibrio parahaemolyticus]|nr:hypothetical protein [Vibrio parahaemolyticus]
MTEQKRKPVRKTAAKEATVTQEVTAAKEPEAVKESPETVSGNKLINVMNVTRYPKVNPLNTQVLQPNEVVKSVLLDNWVSVQLKAGILKEVN